ncbi:hypothetical protein [Nonomuraea endophytica]|uniref:Ig-like domain-containing protein n=1 Tax=Nonomuraea endophytica TaxID=714136 RepID=A0A7W8A1I0_9ACTN|nr:hypothetical protein [Nonomuraea endophytica]MBB5077790.1 hypothetical protein [Nonomuraea endophytica]
MRRRWGAVFVLLAAVLGGLLTGAGAAHANAGDPVCRPALTNTPDIVCAIPAEFDNRPIESIEWTKDNAPLPQFDGIRQILVSCTPGRQLVIGLTINLADDLIPSVGNTPITCPSRTASITSFTCGPQPRGVNYVLCEAVWAGGVDPVTAEWFSPRARRQPVVNTDAAARRTTAAFDCNNPGGPELTFTTLVTVTDALGSRASVSTIPCGW